MVLALFADGVAALGGRGVGSLQGHWGRFATVTCFWCESGCAQETQDCIGTDDVATDGDVR